MVIPMVHLRSKKFEGKKGRERIYYYLVKDVYEGEKKLLLCVNANPLLGIS
jgi:hypothetical protein